MAPRLRLLFLLSLPGCAESGDDKATALAAIVENSRASIAAAAGQAGLPAPAQPRAPDAAAPARLSGGPVPGQSPGQPPGPLLAGLPVIPDRLIDAAGSHPGQARSLLGAGPEALRRWLGEPGLRRPEGPAEVWLYQGPACALDLVLYPAPGGMRVAHAEARANGAEPRTEATCLRELAQGRGQGSSVSRDGVAVPAAATGTGPGRDRGA